MVLDESGTIHNILYLMMKFFPLFVWQSYKEGNHFGGPVKDACARNSCRNV